MEKWFLSQYYNVHREKKNSIAAKRLPVITSTLENTVLSSVASPTRSIQLPLAGVLHRCSDKSSNHSP